MARENARQCTQIKADGTRCRANAVTGSDYCFAHDPASVAERQAARQAGGRVGKTKVLPPETPDAPLSSASGVVALLGETINQVRRGEVDPRVANCVGYLSTALLRALEVGDLEERLATLEAAVANKGMPESPFDMEPVTESEGGAAA